MNTFGNRFCVTTFGESHGPAVGCVIDGCPSGIFLCEADIQQHLNRRKPGQSPLTTARQESDACEILSGVFEGQTIGSPLCLMVRNHDHKSRDYDSIKDVFRPNHGDYTWWKKYGTGPFPGGGRLSARETVARVAAGAVAQKAVQHLHAHIDIVAWVHRVHQVETPDGVVNEVLLSNHQVDAFTSRCPHQPTHEQMQQTILEAKQQGDSVGGAIRCVIRGVPAGALGNPVFDKLDARLSYSMLGLPAAKYFTSGAGVQATYHTGSACNDIFYCPRPESPNTLATRTNHSGGVQGGISNGMPILFEVGFKPVSTIFKPQETVDKKGQSCILHMKEGRHDPCVLPRAVPIVQAMAWLVVADFLL